MYMFKQGIHQLGILSILLMLMLQACSKSPAIKTMNHFPQTQNQEQKDSSAIDQDDSQSSTEDAQKDLPTYLFTLSEAMQIAELVEAYIPNNYDMFEGATAASNREELRAYFQSFIGTMMMLQGLAPGRDIDVMVSISNVPNASASGQQIMVNEGMLVVGNSKSLLSVICHEIAHSAKNHSQKSMADQIFSDLDTFVQGADFNNYMNATYNGTTYTHNKADYDVLIKSWNEIAKKPSDYSKRLESEADIVGGMICAHLGMSAEDFHQQQALLAKELGGSQGNIQTADKLADGTQIPITQEQIQDFVTQFLFPIDSHPTINERDAQLLRTKLAINKYHDKESNLYSGFVDQLAQLTPAALVGAQSFNRPFWYRLGCSHSHLYSLVSSIRTN